MERNWSAKLNFFIKFKLDYKSVSWKKLRMKPQQFRAFSSVSELQGSQCRTVAARRTTPTRRPPSPWPCRPQSCRASTPPHTSPVVCQERPVVKAGGESLIHGGAVQQVRRAGPGAHQELVPSAQEVATHFLDGLLIDPMYIILIEYSRISPHSAWQSLSPRQQPPGCSALSA